MAAVLPPCRPAVGLRQGCPCCAKVAHTAPSPLQVGFFVHLYPHNSVQSFHLHIVDLDVTGPTYEVLYALLLTLTLTPNPNPNSNPNPDQVMKYKNMPAEEVLAVLRAEAAASCEE